jgi:hypothetical protein
VSFLDLGGNIIEFTGGIAESLDENTLGGFSKWLLGHVMDTSGSGRPSSSARAEAYYFGRMIGDALSSVAGAGASAAEVTLFVGAITGDAGITIASGGAAAGAGVSISVVGASAGFALASHGSAAISKSMENYNDNQEKYQRAKADRMNAEANGSGTEGAGKRLTTNEAQLKHMFRDSEGHFLQDTPTNRAMIENTANKSKNFLGVDKYGNRWYAETLPNGTQTWAEVRNGVITEGGLNQIPRVFDPQIGLKVNITP